jgi:hypothetical protein
MFSDIARMLRFNRGRVNLIACLNFIIVRCWTDISSHYSSLLQLCLP